MQRFFIVETVWAGIISPCPRRGGGLNSGPKYFAGSMGARNRVGIGLSYWPARGHKAGVIDSLESILGLLKSLKIRALYSVHCTCICTIVLDLHALQSFKGEKRKGHSE